MKVTHRSTFASWLMLLALTFPSLAPAESGGQGLIPLPDYTGDITQRSALTGDWDGHRTELANDGVQFEFDWTQYVQRADDGGLDHDTAYGGHLDYVVRLDLSRMGVVPGGLVTIRGESRYGQSVNGDVGVVLPVNSTAFFPLTDTLDDEESLTITSFYYTQFLSEKFAVLAGKIDTLDADLNEFASGRGKKQFMDANFLFNAALALRLPYSSLGVGALWRPSHHTSVSLSVINTTDASSDSGFDDIGDGTSASLEAEFQYRLGRLPGGMNVGALYSFDQEFAQIGRLIFQPGQGLALTDQGDTWAAYWSGWQYVHVRDDAEAPIDVRNGVPDRVGFGLFARLGVADEDTNPTEWSASIGVGGRGLFPSRDRDAFGVGYYYTSFQETLLTGPGPLGLFEDSSQGFEAFYSISITPAVALTLDVQAHEPVLSGTDTAVVFGARLNVSF